jgi:hypothetical protein
MISSKLKFWWRKFFVKREGPVDFGDRPETISSKLKF